MEEKRPIEDAAEIDRIRTVWREDAERAAQRVRSLQGQLANQLLRCLDPQYAYVLRYTDAQVRDVVIDALREARILEDHLRRLANIFYVNRSDHVA